MAATSHVWLKLNALELSQMKGFRSSLPLAAFEVFSSRGEWVAATLERTDTGRGVLQKILLDSSGQTLSQLCHSPFV